MDIKKVGVVGCGAMGSGIIQVSANAGYEVIFMEPTQELVDGGIGRIRSFLKAGVDKGKLSADEMDAILKRIQGTTNLNDMENCDLVIEAVFEDMAVKKDTFSRLDPIVNPRAILATNTSCLSVTEIASTTKRPEMVVGLHFFNPVPLMKLVEIIRAELTSDETMEISVKFAESLGKEVVKTKDSPGFIVNRLLASYLNVAAQILTEGIAEAEDIDKAVKLGLGHPMGPFELMDLIGLDVMDHILEAMYEELKDYKYAANPLLKRMVRAGHIGRKAKKGFYDY